MSKATSDPTEIIRRLVKGGRCQFDSLNPCFDNRPHDVPGQHADGSEACAYCTAKAYLATNPGRDKGMSQEDAEASIRKGLQWFKDRDMELELPAEFLDIAVGDMVSVDVSTCDEDADHRVFGTIIEWQTPGPDGGRVWLCELDHFNYDPAESGKSH
ncbi:MAG TPA: hypothetical protein DCF82_04910 [Marinobacter hydrocarbonoclasticus]|uniref:Uncharacterized protein n=1 Tax=Marinobacter nauticus TaxID=2743 RepID=A0A3B8WBR5_MARNT|nr:hypothetical protein [Marinobacter nauticus]